MHMIFATKKQDFCNQNTIPVFAHNFFSFDFFFVVKDITLCVWRTKQLNISRLNLTNVQYAKLVCKLNSLIQSNIANGLYFLKQKVQMKMKKKTKSLLQKVYLK